MDLTTMLKRYKDPNQGSQNQQGGLYGAIARAGTAAVGGQNQQQVQNQNVFQQPEKFSFNAETDPQYIAAMNLAKGNIQTGQNNTLANLTAHGQGNSSYSAGAVQNVANREIANVNNNLLPQFIKQAYDQYQNGITNKFNVDSANYNVGRDKIGDNQWQQTYDAGRTDQADNLAINQGQLTGDYTNPNLVNLLKKQSENSAAWATASPEERIRLHNENEGLSKLLGQTYNKATGTYSAPNTTIRTIAGQTLDSNKQQEHIDLAQKLSEMYGVHVDPKNDPALAYKQVAGLVPLNKQKQDFDQQFQKDTQTHNFADDAIKNGISQQNANNSGASTSNSNSNAKTNQLFDAWKARGTAPAGLESLGVKEGTPYAGQEPKPSATDDKQNMQSQYVSGFDSLPPANRKSTLLKEKATIVKDLGIAGYNAIYSMYIDNNGDPYE